MAEIFQLSMSIYVNRCSFQKMHHVDVDQQLKLLQNTIFSYSFMELRTARRFHLDNHLAMAMVDSGGLVVPPRS